jgi:protein phosphatase
VSGDGATRVSHEDNLAAELVRTGAISPDEARRHPGRHVVTQAMGTAGAVTFSPVTVPLRPGHALVLASDGIEALPEAAIMEVVDGAPDAQQAARRLVDAALVPSPFRCRTGRGTAPGDGQGAHPRRAVDRRLRA